MAAAGLRLCGSESDRGRPAAAASVAALSEGAAALSC